MTTAVLLAFVDGGKEFIDDARVHGYREGHLQIATGATGAGLDATLVRTVPVVDLIFAETCERDDSGGRPCWWLYQVDDLAGPIDARPGTRQMSASAALGKEQIRAAGHTQ
jgi:hypothetical protein